MAGIIRASPPVAKPSGRSWRASRRLGARRVRALLSIGQHWSERDGTVWEVRQIHRKDWMVALEGPGSAPRYVRFSELGRDYRPVGD